MAPYQLISAGVLALMMTASVSQSTAASEKPRGPAEAHTSGEAHNTRVWAIQRELRRLGRKLTLDGEFGPRTATAIRVFEKRSDLPERGEPTEAVLAALKAASRWPQPEPGERFQDCAICPEMVAIPAGRFTMGAPSDDEGGLDSQRPQHAVVIQAFAIGRYEVTVGDFKAFIDKAGYRSSNVGCWVSDEGYDGSVVASRNWSNAVRNQSYSHPVVCVSKDDAIAYATWLSGLTGETYRLPSEAEWEYAARAGTSSRFHTGQCLSFHQANYWGFPAHGCFPSEKPDHLPVGETTVSVGSFGPNAFGLQDMHGNAGEWVQDCWNDNYFGAPNDGTAWMQGECSYSAYRTVGWVQNAASNASYVRGAFAPSTKINSTGFRLVRSL